MNNRKCRNKADVMFNDYDQIKNVAVITRGELSFCFSCDDIPGYLNLERVKFPEDPTPFVFTESDKKYLQDFLDRNCGASDSETESDISSPPGEMSRALTEKDTEPYIEKLGVLEEAKKFRVNFNENYGYGDRIRVGNYLQYVKQHTSKFFDQLNIELPSDLNFVKIQSEAKTSNIHEASILYYETLYKYLKENNLLTQYISLSSGGTTNITDEEYENYKNVFLDEFENDDVDYLEDLDSDFSFFRNKTKKIKMANKIFMIFVGTHTSGRNIGYVYDTRDFGSAPIGRFYEGQLEPFNTNADENEIELLMEIEEIYNLR